jgi:GH18 family chitinase
VNLAFAPIAADGTLSFPDPALGTFVAAAHAADVKVCISVGGSDTIANGLGAATEALIAPAGRVAFIQKISSYLDDNQLDGIDIDFEGSKAVNGDYEGFVTALATELRGKGKITTAALARWFADSVTKPALQAFDFVNVMVYYQTDPDNSLTPVKPDTLSVSQGVLDFFVARGLDKSKAVFGVPFYGYLWKNAGSALPTQLTYAEIFAQYGADAQNDLITRGTDVVLLNGQKTMAAKAKLSQQYGGIMAWEVGQDSIGEGSLLSVINQAL